MAAITTKNTLRRSLLPALLAATLLIGTPPGSAAAQELATTLQPVPMQDPTYDLTSVAACGVPPVAEPLWTSYALTDALFWGRDNQSADRPLVVTVGDNTTLISARDPQFSVAPGVRAFYGQRNPCDCGWEVGYFGIYGATASRSVATMDPFLQMPLDIGTDLTSSGEQATVQYTSVINSAEANAFLTRHEWRDHSQSWLTVDWLAGFRYVGVEDGASILMDSCQADDPELRTNVRYAVRTRNNMFGGQIGVRPRWAWDRWALEGWAKAGLLGNSQKQIQDPLFDYTGFRQRQGLSATGSETAFIGDINLSVIYRLTDVWGIRAGYNVVWIDGLALAPNQFAFANTDVAGTALASSGGMFLSGANLGLEARW
jgi:hypothetical protein